MSKLTLAALVAVLTFWVTPLIERAVPMSYYMALPFGLAEPQLAVGWGWVSWNEQDSAGGYWRNQITIRPPSFSRSHEDPDFMRLIHERREHPTGRPFEQLWTSEFPDDIAWRDRWNAAAARDKQKSWTFPQYWWVTR